MKRAARLIAIFYLFALLALWAMLRFDTGFWWPVTLFLFSPRWVVGVPLLVLVPLTLAFHRRMTLLYALHGLIILFPIMDYRISWGGGNQTPAELSLRLMTCNLGGGSIRSDQLVALATDNQIDVLVLQECASSLSKPVFKKLGWIHRQKSNLAIGSSFELGEMQVVAQQPPGQYNAIAAVCCELRIPNGAPSAIDNHPVLPESKSVQIVDVHFPTFRPALEKARRFDPDTGVAIGELRIQYGELVEGVAKQIETFAVPTVIAGDFNVPVESASYRNYWSHYRNALSIAGTGLLYTKHTRLHGVRIDHVLVDGNWRVVSAIVGPDVGGDHRPVIVELSLTK